MAGRHRMLTHMPRQQTHGPKFMWISKVFGLTIHQFFPRSVDGWSSRMMQGFRLFSGAGSTDGWNEWDHRLGGRDQS
jgi:hypothetical protein